jgi:penicillin-insensitive murein endopeptidase
MIWAARILGLLLAPSIAFGQDAGTQDGASAPAATAPLPSDWAKVPGPAPGPAHAIGGYSAGCVEGATRLPLKGAGFRVARPERGRIYGHPALVEVIRGLGALVDRARGILWIGDMGQARGGPAPTGHASHQTGLDVDVYYAATGKEAKPVEMVNLGNNRVTKSFTARIEQLLEWAAENTRVERIFVHPAIKQRLCADAGHAREWLRKIRPWWGHHDHFHVRLSCPSDSPDCKAQEPLPPGDGCAEIAWWLSKEAKAEREKESKKYKSKIGASPPLPPKCAEVLQK